MIMWPNVATEAKAGDHFNPFRLNSLCYVATWERNHLCSIRLATWINSQGGHQHRSNEDQPSSQACKYWKVNLDRVKITKCVFQFCNISCVVKCWN